MRLPPLAAYGARASPYLTLTGSRFTSNYSN